MENQSSVTYDNLDLWWVYVIHTDAKNEYAQVNQFVNWKPKTPQDFDPKVKYTLRTQNWRKDGKYDRCKVHILQMADTLQLLKEKIRKKRVSYPPLVPSASDYLSEGIDNDTVPGGVTQTTGTKRPRSTSAETAAKKSKAELKDMEKFASELNNLFAASAAPSTSSSSATSSRNLSSTPKSTQSSGLTGSSAPKPPAPNRATPILSAKPSTPTSTVKSFSAQKATSKQSTPPIHFTSISSSILAPDARPGASKNGTHPICRSTQPPATKLACSETVPSGYSESRSKVIRNVERSYPSTSSAPPDAVKFYTADDMKMKDEEVQRLRQQLIAAQDQLAKKDDVILGEIRSLSQRVASIEEKINSKCHPDYMNSVQLWLENHCKSYSGTNSSHSM